MTLPDTASMLKNVDRDMFSLLSGWLEGKECLTTAKEGVEVTLVAVPPHGPYVSAYLEQVINQLKPDAVALDATPLVLRSNMLYAFSVPAAVGLPAYGEIRLKSSGKRYASEVFYPGSTNESAIIKCWLAKIPLLPVGRPRRPGQELSDEDYVDEEMSGLSLRMAYRDLSDSLAARPDFEQGREMRHGLCRALQGVLGIQISERLLREARYSTSRIMEIASLLARRDRNSKLLVIADMKHYLDIEKSLALIRAGYGNEYYEPPRRSEEGNLLMLCRHASGLEERADNLIPDVTLGQQVFNGALEEASRLKGEEPLSEAEASKLISLIVKGTREHPEIARGSSVRGTLAFKEVLAGLCQIRWRLNRYSLEKAALITLPPRIVLRAAMKKSPLSVVSDIAKEVLYGVGFFQRILLMRLPEKNNWMSQEEIAGNLEKLNKDKNQKLPANSPTTIVVAKNSNQRLLEYLEARNYLKRGRAGQYAFTAKSVEQLKLGYERKLQQGEISSKQYAREKERLDKLLPAALQKRYDISKKELAETIMEFMDVVDKKIEKEWGKDINFLRMYGYYRMKADESVAKFSSQKVDHHELKLLIDDMERRGILQTPPQGGDRALTGMALNTLFEYKASRDPRLRELKANIDGGKALPPERSQEIRRYSSGDAFRDVSFRHTLRQMARQKKNPGNISQSDFRVFLKRRHRIPTDTVLCMDTSGSMAEQQKMIYARLAAAMVTEAAMDKGDRVGVVAFDDLGQTTLPLISKDRRVVSDYIVALSAVGATNIGDGIKCAVELLFEEPNHHKRHIFLITDGEPNAISEKAFAELKMRGAGDLTQESALLEVRRATSRGVSVSVIHLTDEKKAGDEFVRMVARAGRGKVSRIICPREIM